MSNDLFYRPVPEPVREQTRDLDFCIRIGETWYYLERRRDGEPGVRLVHCEALGPAQGHIYYNLSPTPEGYTCTCPSYERESHRKNSHCKHTNAVLSLVRGLVRCHPVEEEALV